VTSILREGSKLLGLTAKERMARKTAREKVPRTSTPSGPPADRSDRLIIETMRTGETSGTPSDSIPPMQRRRSLSFEAAGLGLAADLAGTPKTGILVQASGIVTSIILEVSLRRTPARLDINDFDETLHAPWEWDVKRWPQHRARGRQIRMEERHCADAAAWRSRAIANTCANTARSARSKSEYSNSMPGSLSRMRKPHGEKVLGNSGAQSKIADVGTLFPGSPDVVKAGGASSTAPACLHPRETAKTRRASERNVSPLRLTLAEERRVLLDRYHVVDIARKVVGVGMRRDPPCPVGFLLMAGRTDPFPEFKEALLPCLSPMQARARMPSRGTSRHGQRMLQSASDIFLGWTRDDEGHDYYFPAAA